MTKTIEQVTLTNLCKYAKDAWNNYKIASDNGLDSIAKIHYNNWNMYSDSACSYAAKNALKIRKGACGGM